MLRITRPLEVLVACQHHMMRAQNIDLKHRSEAIGAYVFSLRRKVPRSARDNHIDGSETLDAISEGRLDLIGLAHIGRHARCVGAQIPKFADRVGNLLR